MTRRLTILAQLDIHSGYGLIVASAFERLQKRDIFVSLRATGIDETGGAQIPKEMRGQIVHTRQPEQYELMIYPPTLAPTPDRKTIWWTMWESSILAPVNVSILNRSETVAVIVPSRWCKKSFEDSGVTKPIHVVPLGFDPDIFRAMPITETGPVVLGIAGRVAHCSKRKMMQETIDLFLATFKGVENVRLHVKVHPTDQLKDPKDRRVKIFRDVMEGYQLANWLHGLTAFITLARAEGYGLWPLQALACGRPVIACHYSGHFDFLFDPSGDVIIGGSNSFPVPFREVPVDGVGDSNVAYEGAWAQPDMNAAGQIMQGIYRNRSRMLSAAQVSESVAHLTWERSIDKLIAVCEEIGVWS